MMTTSTTSSNSLCANLSESGGPQSETASTNVATSALSTAPTLSLTIASDDDDDDGEEEDVERDSEEHQEDDDEDDEDESNSGSGGVVLLGSGGTAIMPTTRIELSLSCRDLLDLDTFSRSDPFCVAWLRNSWQDRFYPIGRTETIQDCLEPEWVHKFVLDYNFESVQRLRLEFWDEDPDGKREWLGCHETTLAEIVSTVGSRYVRPLRYDERNSKYCGEVQIVAEEQSGSKKIVHIQFGADQLPGSMLCGLCPPDPFLVLSRCNTDGTFSVVHRTELARPSTSPLWRPIQLPARTLCNGDFKRTIRLQCFDHRCSGRHRLLGQCLTTLRQLIDMHTGAKLPLSKGGGGSGGTGGGGWVSLRWLQLTNEITFLDYIKSGTEMHFAVAIDFTASNGLPADPNSLHHIDPAGRWPNPYEIALRAVGDIIGQYNTSRRWPAFGFGAITDQATGRVSHHFPLNGDPDRPYCSDVAEIGRHYRDRLRSVTLYGPTNFGPVIEHTAKIAARLESPPGRHYFVLLIITDGMLTDMPATKRAIIQASALPLSIIIVGVGGANFAAMDELDSDGTLLQFEERVAKRDIVQFVRLNQFLSPERSFVQSQADLAREVLAEIPDQVVGYMRSKSITPTHHK